MKKKESLLSGLSDEQILKEFVKRFECDGAVLVYVEGTTEAGLGRWNSPLGRKWVKDTFTKIKQDSIITTPEEIEVEDAVELCEF
ncbi:hypothetical protein [Flavobacterium sp. DSR3-2]|uniref:hypothetical protein n=1 Tax=Flavobacterium sp. DSR3-2 TaxID=2804634 RepID=UPI003CFA0A2D